LGFTDISVLVKTADFISLKFLNAITSSRIQTTCARKQNKASQDSYLAATLAGVFSCTSREDEPWSKRQPSQLKQNHHH